MLLTSRLERHRRLPPFPLCLPLTKPSPAANATLRAFGAAHAAQKLSQLVRHSTHHARDHGTDYPFSSTAFNGVHVSEKKHRRNQKESQGQGDQGCRSQCCIPQLQKAEPHTSVLSGQTHAALLQTTGNKGIREQQETPDVQTCIPDS